MKRLQQLEQENGRLKKMVADRDLEIDVLKEITRKKMGRRTRAPAAGRVCTCTRSVGSPRVRLALRRTGPRWATSPRLVDRDAPALAVMRRLAAQYPRYGYRRIRIFLKREGHTMSTDRTHRLWRQAGLQVPRRRPRRRVALSRPARPVPATAVNHVWAYDFVFDTCANGQTLKCLTVVDEWTRESLAIDVAGGIRSGARYRGAHAARERPRSPTLPPVRQRPRVCRGCDSPVAAPGADRNRAHRAGEAVAECDRRIVQREVPRRVSEPAVVSETAWTRRWGSCNGDGTTTTCDRTRALAI